MTYTGTVKGGVVELEAGASLPDGTVVRVEPVPRAASPTLSERLKPVIGIAKGLPEDLAENHDHYLHGRPKR
jgi:hypothetical protein